MAGDIKISGVLDGARAVPSAGGTMSMIRNPICEFFERKASRASENRARAYEPAQRIATRLRWASSSRAACAAQETLADHDDRRLCAGCPSRCTVLGGPRSRLTAPDALAIRMSYPTGTRHTTRVTHRAFRCAPEHTSHLAL